MTDGNVGWLCGISRWWLQMMMAGGINGQGYWIACSGIWWQWMATAGGIVGWLLGVARCRIVTSTQLTQQCQAQEPLIIPVTKIKLRKKMIWGSNKLKKIMLKTKNICLPTQHNRFSCWCSNFPDTVNGSCEYWIK